MRDMRSLVLSPFRFLALLVMLFTGLGAGWTIVLGWVLYSFAAWYGDDRTLPATMVLVGAAGLIGAAVAAYGLVVCSLRATRTGATLQGLAATAAFLGSLGLLDSGPGAAMFMQLALVVLLVDAAVIVWTSLPRTSCANGARR